MKKWTRYILLTAMVLTAFAACIVIYIYLNKDKIRDYAVEKVNGQLAAPLRVEEIGLDLFSQFPYVSIGFDKVVLADPDHHERSVLEAAHIYVAFNIYDILLSRYRIRLLAIDSGVCTLHIDAKGRRNFDVLKPSDQENEGGALRLNEIKLTRMQVAYSDETSKQLFSFYTEDLSLSLSRNGSSGSLSCKGTLAVNQLKTGTLNLLSDKTIIIDAALKLDEIAKIVTCEKVSLKMDELKLRAAGNFHYGKKTAIDLKLDADELSIQGLLSLVPVRIPEQVKQYKSSGRITLSASVKGAVTKKSSPLILVNFAVKNGSIVLPGTKTGVSAISCEGSFSNGSARNTTTSLIHVSDFSCRVEEGRLAGHFSLENFNRPFLDMSLNGEIPVSSLIRMKPGSGITSASGKISVDVAVKGFTDDLKNNNKALSSSSGTLKIEANDIVLANSGRKFNKLYSSLSLDGNNIGITSCEVITDKTDIRITGRLNKVFGYLFDRQTLEADITYRSDNLDATQIFISSGTQQKDTSGFSLPEKIRLNAAFSVGDLSYNLFRAQQLSGSLTWTDKKMSVTGLSCKTMNGSLKLDGQIENAPDGKFLISANTELNGLSVYELFRQCNNFGQNEIIDKHVSGKITGKVSLVSVWNKNLDCETDKLFVNADATLSNGELKNYKPLESLSRFADIEDLRNLKFSELHNSIRIANRTIQIPEMEAANNALNITLSGTHTFDNIIDYKLKIRLKELLSKKRIASANEFGEEEPGGKGMNLYLTMTGPASNPKITYDKAAVKVKIKQDLKAEQQQIKQILRKELGIGKDTTIREKQKDNDELEFERD